MTNGDPSTATNIQKNLFIPNIFLTLFKIMDNDIQNLLNYAMKPYFEKSKYNTFIDSETYVKNRAAILSINGSIRRLTEKLQNEN